MTNAGATMDYYMKTEGVVLSFSNEMKKDHAPVVRALRDLLNADVSESIDEMVMTFVDAIVNYGDVVCLLYEDKRQSMTHIRKISKYIRIKYFRKFNAIALCSGLRFIPVKNN